MGKIRLIFGSNNFSLSGPAPKHAKKNETHNVPHQPTTTPYESYGLLLLLLLLLIPPPSPCAEAPEYVSLKS